MWPTVDLAPEMVGMVCRLSIVSWRTSLFMISLLQQYSWESVVMRGVCLSVCLSVCVSVCLCVCEHVEVTAKAGSKHAHCVMNKLVSG